MTKQTGIIDTDEIPRQLYHYTSSAGVLGIGQSKSLWATKVHYMNDSQEYTHAIELAKQSLKTRFGNDVRDKIAAQNIDTIIDSLDGSIDMNFFVTCFSKKRDSLAHWRGYCPPSNGYAISFDTSVLKAQASREGFHLGACIYSPTEHQKVITEWCDKCSKVLALNRVISRNEAQRLTYHLLQHACFMKHECFAEEEEWRLVKLVDSGVFKIQLRTGSATLIPYVELHLDFSVDEHLVWDIVVGPTPKRKLAQKAAAELLFIFNPTNGIGSTTLPYRDW